MLKRLVPVVAILTLLGGWLLPQPAHAQASPLQPVVNGLNEQLTKLDPALKALDPVTSQLEPGVVALLGQLSPIITQLQAVLGQAQPACAAIGPVLNGAAPITTQLQTLLAVDVSSVPLVGTAQPILTTVNALIAQVTGLCAAQVAPTTTTTAAPSPSGGSGTPAPAAALPQTGGAGDLLLPGIGALGLAGALAAVRRWA